MPLWQWLCLPAFDCSPKKILEVYIASFYGGIAGVHCLERTGLPRQDRIVCDDRI